MDAHPRSARRSFDYFAYLPAPIGNEAFPLPSKVEKNATDAERAVRQSSDDLPRGIDAVADLLVRVEAVASSRIEGLDVSHRRLARIALRPDHHDPTARHVLGNVRAVQHAIRVAGVARVAREQVVAIHEALFEDTSEHALAGVVRREQN